MNTRKLVFLFSFFVFAGIFSFSSHALASTTLMGPKVCAPGYIQGNVPTTQVPDYDYTPDGFLELHFRITDAKWNYNFIIAKEYDQNCNLLVGGIGQFADKKAFIWPGVNHLVLRYVESIDFPGSSYLNAYDGDTGLPIILDPNSSLGLMVRGSGGIDYKSVIRIIIGNRYTYSTDPNFWNTEDGDIISTPALPIRIPPPLSGSSNVLFLPGIEASRLYTPRTGGSEDQLWEPNNNLDVEDLYLNTDGTSKNPNIYTRDIIKESNTPIPTGSAAPNIYKSFVNMLDGMINNFTIADFKLFAYDWRQSVDDIVNNGTKYQDGTMSLTDTLQSLVNSSKNGKVTIIAHSNGGLLAKALLKKLQDDKIAGRNNLIDKVDVLILVAVPEIGTAEAVPAILHGYDQSMAGGLLVDEVRARELGRNMAGAFGLLPSKEYLNRVSVTPATFVDNLIPSNITTKLVQAFGSAISSYTEYKDFLLGAEGRVDPLPIQTNLPISLSPSLFTKAESLHDSIDTFVPPASMRVIEVAGWGLETVASFEYYPKLGDCTTSGGVCTSYVLDERPRFTIDGDKTVVVPSAQYMSANGNAEKYWVDLNKVNRFQFPRMDHASILEINSLLSFISNTIQKLPLDNSPYLSTTVPIDTSNRFRISIHSPVTLDAYDAVGNHTGKICPPASDFCYIEENIPNSSYLEFGEGKYINLPEDQFSKIKLQGTDVGTFTYDSEKVLPDGTSSTLSFVDIPVTTQAQAEITLNQTGTPQLALDVTGDGITDFTYAPSSTFDPIAFLQIMKGTIDSLDLSQAKIKALDSRVDSIIKLIKAGKIDSAKLTANRFSSALGSTLSKPDPKNPSSRKLSKTDAQLLLDMLNKLLDNLN